MEYARALRVLTTGWTPELRKEFIAWFGRAANFRGGNSLSGFLKLMRDDMVKTLSAEERKQFEPLLNQVAKAGPGSPADASPPRPFVKKWTMEELTPKLEAGLAGGRDFERGRKLFAEARCFGCHRYGDEGSAYGPDLTGVAGRFSPRDLLESLIDPNKEISDQYAAVEIELIDGRTVFGRIVNLNANNLSINTDMLDPNKMANVNRDDIESIKPSKVSMMPEGLLDVLNEDEIFDLMSYLLSRGDRNAAMFKK
jgi:putative heme-binding domain-containing protein